VLDELGNATLEVENLGLRFRAVVFIGKRDLDFAVEIACIPDSSQENVGLVFVLAEQLVIGAPADGRAVPLGRPDILPTGDFADTQTGGESIRLRGLRARQPRSSTQRSGLAQNCGAIAYAPPLLLQEDGIVCIRGVTHF